MSMNNHPPRPDFDFTKVVNTNVTHQLVDIKAILANAQVWGQSAHAEALATNHAPDSTAQTLTVTNTDPYHTSSYSEFISASNGAFANWLI